MKIKDNKYMTDMDIKKFEYGKLYKEVVEDILNENDWRDKLVKDSKGYIDRIGIYTMRYKNRYFKYFLEEENSRTKAGMYVKTKLESFLKDKLKRKNIKLYSVYDLIDLDEVKRVSLEGNSDREDRYTKGAALYVHVHDGDIELKFESMETYEGFDVRKMGILYVPKLSDLKPDFDINNEEDKDEVDRTFIEFINGMEEKNE